MNNLAIIPARSGSKGLPDKNIKLLGDKPLLAYSVEAAIASGMFSAVMVSTDSEQYATIGRDYGASVPFLRSEKTSSDIASSWDTVDEILEEYHKLGREFDSFCLLQPTSPLRLASDICDAYRLFEEKKAISVVSMCELEHPLSWCGKVKDNLSIEGFFNGEVGNRRQEQAKYYRPNGAIYIADIIEYQKDHSLYRKGGYAFIMPRERSVDIDSMMDFKMAEFFMKERDNR